MAARSPGASRSAERIRRRPILGARRHAASIPPARPFWEATVVLARTPKYGLATHPADPYAPPISEPHPTPGHPRGAESSRSALSEASPHGVDGGKRTRADAHCDRSRRDAPPSRQHGEATGRPRRAPVLSRLQARRSTVPARRRDEVPVAEPINASASEP